MKHTFQKAICMLLTALTALTICLQPVKIPAKFNESGISVCEDKGSETEFSDKPEPSKLC